VCPYGDLLAEGHTPMKVSAPFTSVRPLSRGETSVAAGMLCGAFGLKPPFLPTIPLAEANGNELHKR